MKYHIQKTKIPFNKKIQKSINKTFHLIQRKRWEITSYLFLFFLLIITLGQLTIIHKYINLSFIQEYQTIIIILAITTGALTFWHNRKRIKKEIEEEQKEEEEAEEKRKEEFSEKFPRINKIPILRSFISWMYKEGWKYSIGLMVIILIGFGLRIVNLIILDPYIDEYQHLLAGKSILKVGFSEYIRAQLVSYSVALFYWLGKASSFYEYLFWGRLPGLIFGTLTTIPLYILAKKISKPIGIISAILWITSPWAIGVSRTIREYAFYPFFILIIILILIKLIQLLIEYKQENIIKIITYSLIIIGSAYYAYFIDYLSTLKIIFLIFPLVGISLFFSNYRIIINILQKNKRIFFTVSSLLLILILLSILIFITNKHIDYQVNINSGWFSYFFDLNSSVMQWWNNTYLNNTIYFLLIVGIIYAFFNKKREYFLHLLIFSSFIVFFIFFFDRYLRPRYVFYALPFFTVLIATGIYSIFYYINNITKDKPLLKYTVTIIGIIFIFSTFNIKNTFYPTTSNIHGYVKTTNEYHDKLDNTLTLLKTEIKTDDIFITTFGSMLKLYFDILPSKIYNYNYTEEDNLLKIKDIINTNKQGLIILDSRRNGSWAKGLPKENFYINDNIQVKIIQNVDNIQVYRWSY